MTRFKGMDGTSKNIIDKDMLGRCHRPGVDQGIGAVPVVARPPPHPVEAHLPVEGDGALVVRPHFEEASFDPAQTQLFEAAQNEGAGHPAAALLRARVLAADRLPGKTMLTAGTLMTKARSGASDINKHYGTTGPNYLKGPAVRP